MHKRRIADPDYVYIRRNSDEYLLNGISLVKSKIRAPIILWKLPGCYDLARRFTSIEHAEKCIQEYGIMGASVVDRAGRILKVVEVIAPYE